MRITRTASGLRRTVSAAEAERKNMKILVFSDSHGSPGYMQEAMARHRTADAVIFLGDGERDAEGLRALYPETAFYIVRGNCDFGSAAPDELVLDLDGARIFCTHGHNYGVKYDYYRAVCAARARKANLLLFGHTHQPLEMYDDGLYILNPGSASGYRASYAMADVSPAGILTNIIYRN